MNRKKKNMTFALGTAISLSLAATPAFAAVLANPFQTQTLKSPYLAKAESKPAETMKSTETKAKDGHCGGKAKDGKCGEAKCGDKKMKDGHCGGDKKAKEMKCGEGTCGGKK